MPDVVLVVNRTRYAGWKGVVVNRSIESVAGSFDLDLSDRWSPASLPWPIGEEDECSVRIHGQTVITGYVDRRRHAIAADQRSLNVSGRDRGAALVDCSAVLRRWQFRRVNALAIAQAIAEPFGVPVSLQPGLTLPSPPPAKVVVSPGDSAWEVISRVVGATGLLVVSDGAGGLVLTRAGAARAERLLQGQNVIRADVDYRSDDRFRRYVVVTQIPGTDAASGKATRIRAEATDEGVRRDDRVLLINAESGVSTAYARRRADWEARIRAARAEQVTAIVRGWQQQSGELWPINALCEAVIPAIGVDGTMLISAVSYKIDEQGELTQLTLVRPDAFEPDPQAIVDNSTGMRWKELAGGV